MNVFILEKCSCLIKAKCGRREHAEVPITNKGWNLSSALLSLTYRGD